jgi:hypothetical protein
MRVFDDQLRQRPFSLFMLLGWFSISVASLIIRSTCLDLVDRILVVWSLMQEPMLMMCSAMADLSRCSRPGVGNLFMLEGRINLAVIK